VLQLFLLFNKSLVLSTQRRETGSHLIRKLRDILLRLIVHGCVSCEQTLRCGRGFGWTAKLRLRVKEAALSSEGRIGGFKKRDCQALSEKGKVQHASLSRDRRGRVSRGAPLGPWAVRQACASTFGPGYVASYETRSSNTACRPFRDILALQFHCSRVAL
jgi:hypothetical protein